MLYAEHLFWRSDNADVLYISKGLRYAEHVSDAFTQLFGKKAPPKETVQIQGPTQIPTGDTVKNAQDVHCLAMSSAMVSSSKGFCFIHISYSPYMTFGGFWLENAGNSSIIMN